MHLKEELEREHERRTTEMREAARRLKDDCSHQVEMERFSFIFDCLLTIALRIAVQRIIDKRVTRSIHVLGWGVGKRGWGDGGGSMRRFFIADIVVVRSHDILLPLDTFKNHCLLLPLKMSFHSECFVTDAFGVKTSIAKKAIADFLTVITI